MAAVVTLLGTATFNTTSGTHTVVATPSVNDLIVIVVANTGNAVSVPPTDNNSSGTYTQVSSSVKASSADRMTIYIRDTLITSASSTTFTNAAGTTTGGGLAVLKVTGMTLTSAAAVVQVAGQSNVASGTPAPVFGAAPLTTNPVIGAVFNATNPATMTPRTSFTELADVGYATPTTGLEVMSRNSGETSTTQTWGSASGSAFCSNAIELNANTAAPTVALNSPADASSTADTTPTLNFTGTDADGDSIEYEVQVSDSNAFAIGPPVVDSYNESNMNSTALGTSTSFWGQSLTGDGSTLGMAKFFMACDVPGTLTGNVICKIYAHTGTFGSTGTPTGAALASSAGIAASSLTAYNFNPATGLIATTFTFSGVNQITLTNATKYFVVFDTSGTNASGGNSIYVGFDTTTPTASGNAAQWNGATWAATAGNDISFYVYNTASGGTVLLDKLSTTDAGFTAGHPFASGAAKDFTVQAGDALTTGLTYYWRVRGTDPSGTNTYGAYSTTRSFTISGGNLPPPRIIGQSVNRSRTY